MLQNCTFYGGLWQDARSSTPELSAALRAPLVGLVRDDPPMTSTPQPRPGDSEAYYKVERQLRDAFEGALKAQRSGASVDVRVYFREKPGGELWGGLAPLGEDGRIIDNMPLADPPSLRWLLGVMCELGFEAAPRVRTQPREQAEAD